MEGEQKMSAINNQETEQQMNFDAIKIYDRYVEYATIL